MRVLSCMAVKNLAEPGDVDKLDFVTRARETKQIRIARCPDAPQAVSVLIASRDGLALRGVLQVVLEHDEVQAVIEALQACLLPQWFTRAECEDRHERGEGPHPSELRGWFFTERERGPVSGWDYGTPVLSLTHLAVPPKWTHWTPVNANAQGLINGTPPIPEGLA